MGDESTGLPSEWIAQLFRRFRVAYGSRLDAMWAGVEPDELTNAWSAELGKFSAEDIKLALSAMAFSYKQFPPSLFEFADLCRDAVRARAGAARKIEWIRYGAIHPDVLAEINKLTRHWHDKTRDHRDWARKILQRVEDGDRVAIIAVQYAREALGL